MTAKRDDHLARRRGHGVTIRKLAEEFGMSKSAVHRKLATSYGDQTAGQRLRMRNDVIRDGYIKMGKM